MEGISRAVDLGEAAEKVRLVGFSFLYLQKIIVDPEGPSQPRDPEACHEGRLEKQRWVRCCQGCAGTLQQRGPLRPCLRESTVF